MRLCEINSSCALKHAHAEYSGLSLCAFCQCKRSGEPPLCDGSHKQIGQEELDADQGLERVWYKVAERDDVQDGEVCGVQAGTRTLALTRFQGQYGALDNACPHEGGPLAEGSIECEEAGDCWLRCPWHGWDFHPLTGKSPGSFDDGVPTVPVEERDDGIYVQVLEQRERTRTVLLTGLWDAKVDRAPVLALTGQVNTQVFGPGAFQEIDLASAFQAVSTFSQTVLPGSKHAELMTLALKHAIVERDVAHLIFPDEVQVVPAGDDAKPGGPGGRLGRTHITPDQASVADAVACITAASRPVIIVGYGARDCMDAVTAMAERLHAPVLTTFKAKGQISDAHPLAGGVLGRSGTPIASWCMNEADLLIVLGASFSNHTGITPKKPIIQVDFEQMAKDRKFNRTTAGMVVTIPSDEGCEQAHRRLVGVELGKLTRERRVRGKRCGSSGRGGCRNLRRRLLRALTGKCATN